MPEPVTAVTAVTRKPRKPPWLYDGPLTDRARLVSCKRCHRAVLEALVEDVLAARADPLLLTPAQELGLLVAGGRTVRLWPDPATSPVRRMAFRGVLQIRHSPGRGLPVHDCERQHGRPDPAVLGRAPRTAATSDQPDF